MPKHARLGALVGATALSLTLTACGGSGTSTSASPASSTAASASVAAEHNPADVSFAQQMIVHHQGAIEMVQLATSKASSQEVKSLAQRIEAAQAPEMQRMTSWLKAWGQPVSGDASMSGMGGMGGMSSSSSSMGSMGMSQQDMDQLTAASGKDFDRMFLQMMTSHHQSAIEMAKTEQATGSNPQAISLAKSIQTSQTAEVAEMAQLLRDLGS